MLLLIFTLIVSAFATCPQVGDGSVFAVVPEEPGYPEAIVIDRGHVYVTTPSRFGTAGTGPSQIYVYNQGNGNLEEQITVQGEALEAEHALSGLAVDSQGHLYAIAVGSTNFGILKFSKAGNTWTQETYATAWPSLGLPLPDGSGTIPPLPNSMAFDEDGNLLVSDSLQALIWKVPAGGGVPEVWYGPNMELAPLGASQLGANGLRFSPDREWVYLAYTGGDATSEFEIPSPGKIFRIPYVDTPSMSDLQTVWTYDVGAYADEIAFTRRGDLYVTLAGHNAVSVLDIEDPEAATLEVAERYRISGPNGSSIPFAQPAGLAFHHRRLFVVNHALWTAPTDGLFSVLEVVVEDQGDHEEHPFVP